MENLLTGVRSVRELDPAGKCVLLRTSLNVPVGEGGVVTDTFRLRSMLPTLQLLISKGAKVVIVGYFGREGASLAPVVAALRSLIPEIPVRLATAPVSSVLPEVQALQAGECLVLENIRQEPGEEKNDPALAKALAALADVYVDDAFAEGHRAYASNVGVAGLLPAYMGLLFAEEVERLGEALVPPKGSIAILGGAKFETKEPLIARLVSTYDKVLLCGALANDMFKARGLPIGDSLISAEPVPMTDAENTRIILPVDLTVATNTTSRESQTADIRNEERTVDVGSATVKEWSALVAAAPFVLWNGPLGIYEEGFSMGTDALAESIAKGTARAVIGGGDTAAAIVKHSFDPKRIFVSTGGGAALAFLSEGTLPALEALRKA